MSKRKKWPPPRREPASAPPDLPVFHVPPAESVERVILDEDAILHGDPAEAAAAPKGVIDSPAEPCCELCGCICAVCASEHDETGQFTHTDACAWDEVHKDPAREEVVPAPALEPVIPRRIVQPFYPPYYRP